MSEQTLLPPPDEAPTPVLESAEQSTRDLTPWLSAIGFLVLAAAIFYVWQYPTQPGRSAAEDAANAVVEQRLTEIDTRLTRMEQQPAPDLGKLVARIDALEGRLGDQTQLASRLDTLTGRIQSLAGRNQVDVDALKQQLDSLTRQVASTKANATDLDSVIKRLRTIAKVQEASLALTSGRPIGDLPDAPEALARFAHAAPPTEAQLRLSFPRDAQRALAGEQPDQANAPFIDRVWDRAQGLITIRRGTDVVVGNPAAVILSRAQASLDAGDVAGAVASVDSLTGQPAQAMANWQSHAKALLAARAALAEMAGQA
jgi:hypothetical protein